MCSQCGPGPCLSLLSVGDTITMQCNNGTRVNGTCLKIAFFWQTFSPVWAIMPVSCRHHWNGTFPHFAGCLHATTRHQAAGAPVQQPGVITLRRMRETGHFYTGLTGRHWVLMEKLLAYCHILHLCLGSFHCRL